MMRTIQRLTAAAATAGVFALYCPPAGAAWQVSSSEPHVITFDESVGWEGQDAERNVEAGGTAAEDGNDVVRANHSPADAPYIRGMIERNSGHWYNQSWKSVGLSAESWRQDDKPFIDFNADGSLADQTIADPKMCIDPVTGSGFGLEVGRAGSGNRRITLKVRNLTGQTVTNASFLFDAWYNRPDSGTLNSERSAACKVLVSTDDLSYTEICSLDFPDDFTGGYVEIGRMGGDFALQLEPGEYLYLRVAQEAAVNYRAVDFYTDNWTLTLAAPSQADVPAADGGNVDHDFKIDVRETSVQQYLQFLNAADAAGGISAANGEVRAAATGELFCLTASAEPASYIAYDSLSPAGERFSAVPRKAGHPMIFVSWFGAAAYCNWQTARQGLAPVYDPAAGWSADTTAPGCRLPAESEWHKAAAWDAGAGTFRKYGNSSDTLDDAHANFLNSGDPAETETVRTLGVWSNAAVQSPYGLAGTSGNVWEWCHNPFDNPDGTPGAADDDPRAARAARGGSWGNLKQDITAGTRSGFKPEMALSTVGFRVLTIPQQQ